MLTKACSLWHAGFAMAAAAGLALLLAVMMGPLLLWSATAALQASNTRMTRMTRMSLRTSAASAAGTRNADQPAAQSEHVALTPTQSRAASCALQAPLSPSPPHPQQAQPSPPPPPPPPSSSPPPPPALPPPPSAATGTAAPDCGKWYCRENGAHMARVAWPGGMSKEDWDRDEEGGDEGSSGQEGGDEGSSRQGRSRQGAWPRSSWPTSSWHSGMHYLQQDAGGEEGGRRLGADTHEMVASK
jgi:type IV secretory pathway VirB10-like protein